MHPNSARPAAAPDSAQDARRPSAANARHPGPRQRAAVGRAETHLTGAVASDAGIAGMAGSVGATRPEECRQPRWLLASGGG